MKYRAWMNFIGCIEEWEGAEPVEVYDGNEWKPLKKKDFESFPKLRIKPKPREFWINPTSFTTYPPVECKPVGCIKVREVL